VSCSERQWTLLILPTSRCPCCVIPALQADIAHDHKAAQLEDGTNTLLGLDANRLCKWDLRDPRGVVQVSAAAAAAGVASCQCHQQTQRSCRVMRPKSSGVQMRGAAAAAGASCQSHQQS
jgi:hypothetical protein